MNIVVFGINGMIGQRIVREALARDHKVTGAVRDLHNVRISHPNLRLESADVTDGMSVARIAQGHDAVITAIGPRGQDVNVVVDAARGLLDGLPQSHVRRLLIVGGAGSLEVAPGKMLMDTPEFPADWQSIARVHYDALKVYQESSLDWSYLSPPAIIEPGTRTGKFRVGTNKLLVNDQGVSRISAEDYAIAMIDELENPQHIRQRFTVAY